MESRENPCSLKFHPSFGDLLGNLLNLKLSMLPFYVWLTTNRKQGQEGVKQENETQEGTIWELV